MPGGRNAPAPFRCQAVGRGRLSVLLAVVLVMPQAASAGRKATEDWPPGGPVDRAIKSLRSGQPANMAKGCDLLGKIPVVAPRLGEVARELAGLVGHADSTVRRRALVALRKWNTDDVTAAVGKAIQHSDGRTRTAAIRALWASRDPRAADLVAACLAIEPSTAIPVLQRMGALGEAAAVKQLRSKDVKARKGALETLRLIGMARGISAVKALLRDKDSIVRRKAQGARDEIEKRLNEVPRLEAMRVPTSKPLRDDANAFLTVKWLAALEAGNDRDARPAAGSLAELPVDAKCADRVARALVARLGTKDRRLLESVIKALRVWHTPASVPPLLAFAGDNPRHVGNKAFGVLSVIDDPRAVEAVVTAFLKDPRASGLDRELVALGPAGEVELLRQFAAGTYRGFKAARVLEVVGSSKSLPMLARLSKSGASQVRKAADAARTIIESGQAHAAEGEKAARPKTPEVDEAAIRQLLADLSSADSRVRHRAAKRLARLGPIDRHRKEATAGLVALLKSPGAFVRRDALQALGVWHTPDAIPAMTPMLADGDFFVRVAAFEVLGRTRDPRVAEALAGRLGKDSRRASQALCAMGTVAEPAVVKRLRDGNSLCRLYAAKVLARIGTTASIKSLTEATRGKDSSLRNEAASALEQIRRRAAKKGD